MQFFPEGFVTGNEGPDEEEDEEEVENAEATAEGSNEEDEHAEGVDSTNEIENDGQLEDAAKADDPEGDPAEKSA